MSKIKDLLDLARYIGDDPEKLHYFNTAKTPYGGYRKKLKCEYCGFKALHSAQIDVDQIDGNHENNEISNLQSLCANCHRLKTIVNRDHVK